MRYRAFISYSHRDERWAKWLQSALEGYRLPRRLQGEGAARLHPVFRDRSELGSSADLSESIRAALDDSAALVVICSPAAAASRWVGEEIRYFQRRGEGQLIHCLIIDGSPDADDPACAFPPALLRDATGVPLPEPLAADVRKSGDGRRGALLKIVAGLQGVGIDDLKQRDAQRQIRRRGLITGASLMLAVLMLGIAVVAQLARQEAELRRQQAESLISFMLGDLRAGLEPLGRLDLLDSVGDEALRYFAVLGEQGTKPELRSRIMALRQIGEVRFRQGRLAPARAAFEESRRLAEALHAADPGEQSFLFELGQSEFWVGYAALEQSDLEQTERSFTRYMSLSQQLLAMDPANPDYRKELSYAFSNLGTVAREQRRPAAALEYFRQSVVLDEALFEERPEQIAYGVDLGNGYSWLGATHLQLGRLADSGAAYERAVDILKGLRDRDPSPLYAENLAQNLYHLGNVLAHRGALRPASDRFEQAIGLLEGLVAHDPDNAIWQTDLAIAIYHRGDLARVLGRSDARAELERARDIFEAHLRAGDLAVESLALTERSLALLEGDPAPLGRARERLAPLAEAGSSPKPRTALAVAMVGESHGGFFREAGQTETAAEIWQESLSLLRGFGDGSPTRLAVERVLHGHLGDTTAVAAIDKALDGMGFADPRFGQGPPGR